VLRTENQQLREENNRLTDLTRMLLSSQAFSGFLQELSQSGQPLPQQTRQQPTQERIQTQAQPRTQRKDVGSHDATRQMSQHAQVGMAMIPETNVDLSLYDNSWNTALPSNDFQVYAVTELPEPPVLDLAAVYEKPAPTTKSDTSKLLPPLPTTCDALKSTNKISHDQACTVDTIRPNVEPESQPSISTFQSLDEFCAAIQTSCDRLAALLPANHEDSLSEV
jgi:hypothetical protein